MNGYRTGASHAAPVSLPSIGRIASRASTLPGRAGWRRETRLWMLELSRSTFRTLIHYIENPEADKLSSKSHIPAGVPAPIRPSYERERTSTFKFADDQPRLPDRESDRGIRRMARRDARRGEAKQREPILLPFSRDVLVLDPNIAPLKRPRIVRIVAAVDKRRHGASEARHRRPVKTPYAPPPAPPPDSRNSTPRSDPARRSPAHSRRHSRAGSPPTHTPSSASTTGIEARR